MCGFAGFITFEGQQRPKPERLSILQAMGRQLKQRGPDDERFFDDGVLSLVYCRLSIIDLSGGQQPIWNEAGTIFTAINGEIYNHHELRAGLRVRHQFRTQSDSEVVVHLFEEMGTGLLELLNGMFALVVWDTQQGSLLLARDRLGIKPLYYVFTRQGLLFGSELKALLVHPDCPTEFRWRDLDFSYLSTEAYTTPDYARIPTFVEGVEMLPGGTYLEWDRVRGLSLQRYWTLDKAIESSLATPPKRTDVYVDEFTELFQDSVHKRMMSDVPVGAFLSGGLDSSAIVAAASRNNSDLHCFTVYERTTVAAGDVDRAKELTARFGLPLHLVCFDHKHFAEQLEFSLETFEYFIWMIDAPRFAPESFFKHELHRYAKTVEPDLKVIFLGQGADEFCGGYSRPIQSNHQTWEEYMETTLLPTHHDLTLRARGVPQLVRPLLQKGVYLPADSSPYHREMHNRLWALQSHNLWNEDRVSSSQSIEARVPFLDHRLVEFLAAIPPHLHRDLFWDKRLLRLAVKPWLSETFTHAPKVPFWESGVSSSVHHLMRQCMCRVYSSFRDVYTRNSDALFSAPQLDLLHTQATTSCPMQIEATKTLLACMAIAVFERMCRKLRSDTPVQRLRPPSPLHEVITANDRFKD